ncbi:preprotein translocase subunit SecE,preprotein translocase, SecE subunit,SecE/Sec61-gamma subunits of protein translocation complex [Chlamydia serpentis]|uniref:Protein translocase subunit SecE n=1 Tax=Chlamydia serpentis TaxID=1967782 RepID=A0A2R8FA96_9CHLA|nr:preprotein translocase subunit SecE [Chlamydia serpentis]SPN73242.1 preprotein translocase subunit SecE,preprotein translocase, SecE subunit,SecE/Sec61-gamma subunits of protein translocation complex [Chlamydia serpentis]
MKQQHNREALSRKLSTVKKQAKFAGSFLDEIKKVEWVSKRDLKKYIKIILVSIFGFGFAIYFIDLLLRKLLMCLDGITTFLFG